MTAMRNFKRIDMLGSTADRPAAPAKKAAQPAQSNDVPEGTADEIVAWVDGDATRARKALAVERKNDHPRVTVVNPLEKIVADDKLSRAAKKATSSDEK